MEKNDINDKTDAKNENEKLRGLIRRRGNPNIKQSEAKHKCSKCERWSLSIGICPFCTAKWFVPVYHE